MSRTNLSQSQRQLPLLFRCKHHTFMQDMHLRAELLPDVGRVTPAKGDVIRFVGLFVTYCGRPAMFVWIAQQLPVRIPMGRKSQTESDDSTGAAVDPTQRRVFRGPDSMCRAR